MIFFDFQGSEFLLFSVSNMVSDPWYSPL